MAFSNEPLSPPEAEDFQRMGLRRMEFRPPVIRRAIIRSAQPLVLMHLRSPSAEIERLLVGVMLSGYRVLDPRRRDDSNQRVMLGRIHPQLVEEAVYLAQKKPVATAASPAPSQFVSSAANSVAANGSVGGSFTDDAEARMPMEFSPIAERDWLESAEPNLGVADRLLSGGFAPEMNPSDRFLDVPESVAWEATLTGSDLMAKPPYQRIYRAIRRRLARASAASLVSAAMLAASILLVMTWRTTVWIRSIGDRPASVVVAESVLSPAEVARIAAAAEANVPDNPATEPALPAPTSAVASVSNAGVANTPTDLATNDPKGVTRDGDAGTAVQAAGVEEAPAAGVELADAVGPMPTSEQPLMPLTVDPAAVPATEVTMATAASVTPAMSSEPSKTPSPTDVASSASDASPTKKADDERIGLELLGLAEPTETIGGSSMTIPVKLPSLPDENLLGSARLRVESAARAIRVADGGSPLVGRAAAASGVRTFRRVAGESAAESPERFVAILLAGQTAALAGLPNDANRAIEDLTRNFDIDGDAAIMRLTRWMAADVGSSEELRGVGTWIDGQVRASMLEGELVLAGELVAVMQEIGLKHRDDELRGDAKLWRDVLVISQRYADANARIDAGDGAENASPDDRGLAGRYWAQVRRDWIRALPHLAACSTPKLTKLAGIELLGGEMLDAQDAETLADGYLAEAKKAKGWLGESFALQSHKVLTLAAANSDRIAALELNRRAGLVKVDYPNAFKPANDRVASSDADDSGKASGDSAAKPAISPNAPADGTSSMSIPDRGPAQMLGRLRIGGEDAAVLIRYQAGMQVTRKLIDQMIVGLENAGGIPAAQTAMMPIELEFAGTLSVERAQTVTFHLSGNEPGGMQSLSINGRSLPIDSTASVRAPKRFEVDLMRGEYLIRWTTTLADDDQLSLQAVDESTSNSIPIFAPPPGIANHPGALPTRLRVSLIAAE